MSKLENKIDFAALLSVTMANPNGDPLDGNRPRVDLDGVPSKPGPCGVKKLSAPVMPFTTPNECCLPYHSVMQRNGMQITL